MSKLLLSLISSISLAFASDGAALIDQKAALAGGITPGDTPGFPVTLSQPGSYRLSGNLTVPDADTTAIRITADAVTLDLNGFSIIGPLICPPGIATCLSAGDGIGIEARRNLNVGPRALRISNGSVRGVGSIGIVIEGSGNTVERVTVDSNPKGGMTVGGSVIASSAIRNGAFGIIAGMVRDSTAAENAGDGILLSAGGVASGKRLHRERRLRTLRFLRNCHREHVVSEQGLRHLGELSRQHHGQHRRRQRCRKH